MSVTPITQPAPGERVIGIFPVMKPDGVQTDWRRLNFFTGRALSDIALNAEQRHHAVHLALRGQMVSPGVVDGLMVDIEIPPGSGPISYCQIGSGSGLTIMGEDVSIPRPFRVAVSDLPVYAPVTVLDSAFPPVEDETPAPAEEAPTEAEPGRMVARRLGPTLGELTEAGVTLPPAGILVLQPVVVDQRGRVNPDDPCGHDPTDDAFEDWQLVDGSRLVLYTWPEDWIPLPVPGPQWRNRIAHTIFEAERRCKPGEYLPWEMLGVPIGLVGFDDHWNPLFVDSYAVVRAGGKPRRRNTILPDIGNPFLWQAQMQQFAEQISEAVGAGQPITAIAEQFRYLPPSGLLPKEALEFGSYDAAAQVEDVRGNPGLGEIYALRGASRSRVRHQHFFPSSYWTDVQPIPLEQLDLAFESSASLSSYDFYALDSVRLLVPVPQTLFEPNLLVIEEVDPKFEQTLNAFIARRAKWLLRRQGVRTAGAAIVKTVTGQELQYPDPDPNALEPNEQIAGDPIDTAIPELSQPEEDYLAKLNQTTEELSTYLGAQPFLAADMPQLSELGLEKFIQYLDAKVHRADDRVDLGFTRLQANIYSVRQIMLGNVAATRLATSPVLAEIAQGETAVASKEAIQQFYNSIKETTDGQESAGAGTGEEPAGPEGGAPDSSAISGISKAANPTSSISKLFVSGDMIAGTASKLDQSEALPSASGATAAKEILKAASSTASRIAAAKQLYQQMSIDPSVAIFEQGSIVGKAYNFRTTTIAARLKDSPAAEAKASSVAARFDIVRALANLDINLEDIDVLGVPFDKEGKTIYVENGPYKGWVQRQPLKLAQLMAESFKLGNMLLNDPDPPNADESKFFTAAIDILESAIATLRLVEGRIQAYRIAIGQCQKALKTLSSLSVKVDRRLKVIGDELAEARHDVSVARALLADEELRVAGINQRRDDIIEKHVKFLAYHRPRLSDLMRQMPVHDLLPVAPESAVAACLKRPVSVPPELQATVELFRDIPLKWLLQVPDLLDKFDRRETLQGVISMAKERASLARTSRTATIQTAQAASLLGVTLAKVQKGQQEVLSQYRSQTAAFNLETIAGLSWLNLRALAVDALSLGDLIDAGHGQSEVVRGAAQELNQIAHVAACLYGLFGEVLPIIRLEWSERLSQYDEAVDLRNLAALPRWGEIEYLHRKEIQSLVDWLFQQVDVQQAAALSLMNDLVRVCILLASHAPVNQIIAGHVTEPATVKPGSRVKLTIDPSAIHIGMTVAMYAGDKVVAQGIVEDLAADQASARVVATTASSVQLDQGARVQFSSAPLGVSTGILQT